MKFETKAKALEFKVSMADKAFINTTKNLRIVQNDLYSCSDAMLQLAEEENQDAFEKYQKAKAELAKELEKQELIEKINVFTALV
jgi:hypothetical protein